MTRGILIAGNESPLTGAVSAEAAKRVERHALVRVPNRFSGTETGAVETSAAASQILLSWNPGSPISARALVIAAENRLEHIDEAILVCAPPSLRRTAADLTHHDIEIMANDHIKGWFFLIKELTSLFRAKKAGALALVFSEIGSSGGRDDKADLLGPAAAAAFRAFSQSVLNCAFDEPYLTLGFSSAEAGEESAFASYIFKILGESGRKNKGRWYKFGRLKFFN